MLRLEKSTGRINLFSLFYKFKLRILWIPTKKVLVVEDSDYQRAIYIYHLNQLGFYNLTEAKDGSEAFSQIEKETFDLIISDWEMPLLDGLELLKKVRVTPSAKDTPFIMITVHEDQAKNQEAIDQGANDFIVKPITLDVLKEKLEKFC